MDSSQFTQQLVEFSQVEQQINSNQNLESADLADQEPDAATDAVSYLGKTLTVTDGTAALMNGQANWAYSPEQRRDDRDTPRRLRFPGKHGLHRAPAEYGRGTALSFTWNRRGQCAGSTLSPGTYTLRVTAQDGGRHRNLPTHCCRAKASSSEVNLTGSRTHADDWLMGVPLEQGNCLSPGTVK